MHDVNWYSAMVFNRLLGRTGHFWESRFFSVPLQRYRAWAVRPRAKSRPSNAASRAWGRRRFPRIVAMRKARWWSARQLAYPWAPPRGEERDDSLARLVFGPIPQAP